jgi:hypothetical protein
MRSFDSGAGENVMEWCLSSSSLCKKSSIKFSIPKKRGSWLIVLGGGQSCSWATRSSSGRQLSAETL